ncbi:MAG: hypothetical protein ACXVB9_12435 [Bdellovibrionota bacterium]
MPTPKNLLLATLLLVAQPALGMDYSNFRRSNNIEDLRIDYGISPYRLTVVRLAEALHGWEGISDDKGLDLCPAGIAFKSSAAKIVDEAGSESPVNVLPPESDLDAAPCSGDISGALARVIAAEKKLADTYGAAFNDSNAQYAHANESSFLGCKPSSTSTMLVHNETDEGRADETGFIKVESIHWIANQEEFAGDVKLYLSGSAGYFVRSYQQVKTVLEAKKKALQTVLTQPANCPAKEGHATGAHL